MERLAHVVDAEQWRGLQPGRRRGPLLAQGPFLAGPENQFFPLRWPTHWAPGVLSVAGEGYYIDGDEKQRLPLFEVERMREPLEVTVPPFN